jgi:hypothetical protein
MRLPGTWNLSGRNNLPTAELLQQYQELKLARRTAKAATSGGNDNHTNDSKGKTKDTTATKVKKTHNPQDDKPTEHATDSSNTEFTAAQDKALLELKLASKSWKDIAIELGKDQAKVKARWKQIQPKDFDQKMAGLEKANANKNKGGGDGGDNWGNGGGGKQSKKEKRGAASKPATTAMEPDEYWTRKDVRSLSHFKLSARGTHQGPQNIQKQS